MREMGNWREYQKQRLANDREAAIDYLQLTLEEYLADGDLPFFLKGLRTFVESQGGVSELSKRTNIEHEILLDALSNEDAPLLGILNTIVNAFECQLPTRQKEGANFRIKKVGPEWKFFAGKPVDQLKHNSADLFLQDVPTNKSLLPLIGVIHSVQWGQRAACVATFSD